jgi:beta-ribofuranosylaminobenzene 5'-phosphate synthase
MDGKDTVSPVRYRMGRSAAEIAGLDAAPQRRNGPCLLRSTMSYSTDHTGPYSSLTHPAAAEMYEAQRPTVSVRAPGRLHLGFLDPSGMLGRRFGSLGLVIDGFETEVELSTSASLQFSAEGPAERAEIERAAKLIDLLQTRSGRREPLHVKLVQVLPAHAGLGSGTQLALALGRAFANWHRLDVTTATLAQWLDRGLRSGIGIGGFDQGGLLVDGGPGADGTPAPILSRIALPESWRALVVLDTTQRGLSGAREREAMATLPALVRMKAAEICHRVLMQVLPGAASAEFEPFAAGITHIQRLLGQHFAPAQNGSAYTSPAVGRLIEWIAARCTDRGAATGQSSWGPTGFAILPSQAQADAVVEVARSAGMIAPSLTLRIVSGRNTGASMVDRRPPE